MYLGLRVCVRALCVCVCVCVCVQLFFAHYSSKEITILITENRLKNWLAFGHVYMD